MASVYETTIIVLCGFWTLGFLYLFWARLRVPQFHRLQFSEAKDWPLLSVIIPACNEAANIESAVESLLGQNYPNLEVILINDRSRDGTAEIIDRLALGDGRIRSLHVGTLPDGWLGKVHALDRGVQLAEGDWFLFTDADVHFAAGTLRRAVGWAIDNRIDHLALAPLAVQGSFLLDIVVHTFMLLFLIGTRAAGINRPASRAFAGVGAFNLVRRSAFQRTLGFSWLRLEPCDDVGLGLMIKRTGGRSFFAFAQKHLTVVWYPTVAAMFKGLEKNLFGSTANYHWWLMLINTFGLFALALAPGLAVVGGLIESRGTLIAPGLTAVTAHWAFSLCAIRQPWRSRFSLLFAPVGLMMIGAMMVHAGWKCLSHGGIDWRGTRYPLEQLRAGQRVKLLAS
jgi:glycosyltransferase involved in cell wall biosynthesis